MDHELLKLFEVAEDGADGDKATGKTIRYLDDSTGEIEVTGAEGSRKFTLKPLAELYGPGNNVSTVDPKDDRFMPLFLVIEEEIMNYFLDVEPGLTDGQVSILLHQFGMNPEAAPADALARRVQVVLRMTLSMNNYSRPEVKSAFRRISKSVDLHSRSGGRKGYLDFIVQTLGKLRRR